MGSLVSQLCELARGMFLNYTTQSIFCMRGGIILQTMLNNCLHEHP